MNYVHLSKIEVVLYSVACAFFFKYEIMDALRHIAISYLKYRAKKKKDFSEYNKAVPEIMKPIRPMDCIQCLSFWICLSIACVSAYGRISFFLALIAQLLGLIIDNSLKKLL